MTDRAIYGMALVAIRFSGLTINATEPDSRTLEANAFLNEFVGRLQPLQTEVNLAWWDASTKGDDESFRKKQEAENRIDAMLADPVHFQRLNTLRERSRLTHCCCRR